MALAKSLRKAKPTEDILAFKDCAVLITLCKIETFQSPLMLRQNGAWVHNVCFKISAYECSETKGVYWKSTDFGVLLYLANSANCVFSLIFVTANIYVDRTLHRGPGRRRQI